MPLTNCPPPTALRRILLGGGFVVVLGLGLFVARHPSREGTSSPKPSANTVSANPQLSDHAKPDRQQTWNETWQRYQALPSSPERDASLANHLKALSVENEDIATDRLRELHPTDRIAIVTATLRTTARKSADDAVLEAVRFCDEDPSYSLEYGRALIATLSSTGEYHAALRFVLAEESEGWLGENGNKWLTSLFSTWAKAAPEQALQTAETMVPPNFRSEVLQTIAGVQAEAHVAL